MEHLHSIYDTDLHFVIDPITRQITSESGKVVLMQNDHNSERFTFEIPRFVEGHDMSLSDRVQIHYINSDSGNKKNQNADVYEADDVQVSPDNPDAVIFSWLLSRNATIFSGALAFVVRFVCYSEDEITYQWFSNTFEKIKINAAIYNGEEIIPDEYDIDVLEKWRRDVVAAFEASDVYKEVLSCHEKSLEAVETVSGLIDKANEDLHGIIDRANDEIAKNFEESGIYKTTVECRDQSVAAIQETKDTLNEIRHIATQTEFHFNFETGHLEYDSPNYDWRINHTTGNLEWEVANE